MSAFEDFTTGDCKHTGDIQFAGDDANRCCDCGAISTDSGSSWGVARMKWFDSRDAALFYKAHGRLPERSAKTVGGK